MSLARVKPAGWATNETLTSGQANSLDINVTNALDKRAGQTDTLSSDITVASGASFNFNASADILGTPTVRSGATLTFVSGSGIAGTTEATLTLIVGSTLENAGETITSGLHTQSGRQVKSGSAATTAWRRTTGTDASIEIDEAQDEWAVPTLTSARTWTLDTTSAPAAAGIRVRVSRTGGDTQNNLVIQTETGPATLCTLTGNASPSAGRAWAEFVWTGSAWALSAWGGAASV